MACGAFPRGQFPTQRTLASVSFLVRGHESQRPAPSGCPQVVRAFLHPTRVQPGIRLSMVAGSRILARSASVLASECPPTPCSPCRPMPRWGIGTCCRPCSRTGSVYYVVPGKWAMSYRKQRRLPTSRPGHLVPRARLPRSPRHLGGGGPPARLPLQPRQAPPPALLPSSSRPAGALVTEQ